MSFDLKAMVRRTSEAGNPDLCPSCDRYTVHRFGPFRSKLDPRRSVAITFCEGCGVVRTVYGELV